jgi:hypothetical protein
LGFCFEIPEIVKCDTIVGKDATSVSVHREVQVSEGEELRDLEGEVAKSRTPKFQIMRNTTTLFGQRGIGIDASCLIAWAQFIRTCGEAPFYVRGIPRRGIEESI